MFGRLVFLCTLLAFGASLGACSGGSSSQSAASPSLTASVTATESATVAATTTATAAASVAAATASPTLDPTASVTFTDIAGNFAETAIKQEAALGVFGTKTGKFNPDATVNRAQYVTWLVTANNIYFKDAPSAVIRLAGPSSDQTFVDVSKNSPNFPQIEGMADAGFVIGVDAKHFAPAAALTREELIAIQVSRYLNGATPSPLTTASGMYCVRLGDAGQVSKPYWGALNADQCTGFSGQDELHRIFGTVRTLHPQRPATRAEVAVALQKIAGRNAGAVLQQQGPQP